MTTVFLIESTNIKHVLETLLKENYHYRQLNFICCKINKIETQLRDE